MVEAHKVARAIRLSIAMDRASIKPRISQLDYSKFFVRDARFYVDLANELKEFVPTLLADIKSKNDEIAVARARAQRIRSCGERLMDAYCEVRRSHSEETMEPFVLMVNGLTKGQIKRRLDRPGSSVEYELASVASHIYELATDELDFLINSI